jgi:hypothetical protein
LREILSVPPERLAGMGRAGYVRVRECHDKQEEARHLEALIEGNDRRSLGAPSQTAISDKGGAIQEAKMRVS